MEYIYLLLLIFVLCQSIVKVSFVRWYFGVTLGVVAGGFILLVSDTAAGMSGQALEAWIGSTTVASNLAVLITIETLIVVSYIFMELRCRLGTPVSPLYIIPLRIYPCFMLFPMLFYLLVQIYISTPGLDFDTAAYLLSGGIVLLISGGSMLIRWILPEGEFRLELLFILSIMVCVIGLIATSDGKTVYAAVDTPIDAQYLMGSMGVLLALLVMGFFIHRLKKFKTK